MHGLANVAFVLSFDSISPVWYIQDLQAAQPVDGCLTRCWDSSCCSFMHLSIQEVTYQTRERVFHQDIQTQGNGLKKTKCSRVFFNQLQGVWIPDETFFRVFGMASQTTHYNSWRNSKQKFANFYAN